MKKLYLLIITVLIVFLNFFNLKGQAYYNFPDSNTIWNIYIHNVWTNANEESTRYAFFEDTVVINNNVYSILYELDDDTTLNISNATYFALFREDSTKKVYCRFDTTDILLYDFSLNVGDTIYYNALFYGGYMEPYTHSKVLDSINSIEINGEYRKMFFLSGGITGNTWIEGIGAIDGEGLFAPIADICTCGFEYYLACVKENDTVIYINNPMCSSCFCSLYANGTAGFKDINNKLENVYFYPNPTTGKISIETEDAQSVDVINIQGEVVLSQKTNLSADRHEDKNQKYEFDLSNQNKGIYIIKVTTDKGVAVGKVVLE